MIRNKILFVILGSMLAAGAAFANETSPSYEPRKDQREMDCRFSGVFGDPKAGGSWEVCCRAEAEFELKDHDRSEQEKNRLRVICEASGQRPEKIYDDGLRVRKAHGWDTMSSKREDLIFSGIGRHSPDIFVNNVDLRDDRQVRAAALTYQDNGFTYTLQGECRIKKDGMPTIDVLE